MLQEFKIHFFAYFLALLIGWLCFDLKIIISLISLTVGLSICKAELISGEVADVFFKYSW